MSETERAVAWIVGDDTGSSSKALWVVMMGHKDKARAHFYPRDGSDLGRCLRLLALIPEWEARMPEMAAVSEYWAALVKNWPELKALHAEDEKLGDHGRIYKRMREVLDPIADRDTRVVRLGGGVELRFGR